MKSEAKTQFRQGDVFLVKIKSLPAKRKEVAREGGRLVLAHGVSTGHNHAIPTPRCRLFTAAGKPGLQFLEVPGQKANLVHDEHSTITLPKGVYQVMRQREYSGLAVRRVED